MPLSPLQILHDDSALVAIHKPSGLATIPGRAENTSCLEQLAAQLHLPCTGDADPRLRVVHRLDKGTSGVLLFAKTRHAQRHLCAQFMRNLAAKEYLALVVGRPLEPSGSIDAPLGPAPGASHRMAVRKHGRTALTDWRLEQALGQFALLRCFPRTGRTHQIRVHLKSIGLPLAIDPLYNPPPPGRDGALWLSAIKRDYRPSAHRSERPLIDRLTLHAEKLAVTHPDTGDMLSLHALLPKDFRATLNQLARHG